MLAIFKREISAYFSSTIGYIVLAAFYLFGGIFFYMNSIYSNTSNLASTFSNLFIILVFIIPILTMRLFSEEKRQKTEQALLTAPIRISSIVMGKFLASLVVFKMCVAVTLIYALIIASFTSLGWAVVFTNIVGLILLGAAFIAIGTFMSSVTENQVVAAVGSLVILIIVWIMDSIGAMINIEWITKMLNKISFIQHYKNFTVGVLDLTDIIFFVSVCALFIFLTVRVIEKKRWS